MTNLEKMTRFLNDVQGIFMQYGWPYILPKVYTSLDSDKETPDDRVIDAHWETPQFQLLVSLDSAGFCFYGDNFGDVKVRHGEASPNDVAGALRVLQTVKAVI